VNILDKYLLQQFGRNLVLVLAAFAAIYVLVDFFERIDNFIDAGKSTSLALRYLVLKVPSIVEQLMPVCILLAGILTLGLLSYNNELIALQAGGVSAIRVMAPIAAGGLLCTFVVLAAWQWLLPATVSANNRIWYEEVQHKVPQGIYRHPRFYYKGEKGFYTYMEYDPQEMRFGNFFYSAWDDEYHLAVSIYAKTATWQQEKGWYFQEGQLKTRTADGDYSVEMFAGVSYNLPDTPSELFIPEYKDMELSLAGLYREAGASMKRGDPAKLQVFHGRLSSIFLGLPLLLVGLPMVLLVHRKWGRDLSLAIPASCVLAFLAWISWGALQSLAKAGYIHPALASWFIHFLVAGAGIYAIRKQAE